jgi:hypothetical protein
MIQHTIFVPLVFGDSERIMFSVIPHDFTVRLKKKLGKDTSKSILNAARRRANGIMANVMIKSSHNGYETNNNNRSLAHLRGLGVTYTRFKNNITEAQRRQLSKSALALLNTRPNNKKGNNLHSQYDYNTGVLVTYSAPLKSPRI